MDSSNSDTYQFFCDREQKSKVANIEITTPNALQGFSLQEKVIQSRWIPICENDGDCGTSIYEVCNDLQAYFDDTMETWFRVRSCDTSLSLYYESLCGIYGDFTLTNQDYDGTEVGYQISFNCEEYRDYQAYYDLHQDIGGAKIYVVTMIASLAAFMLLN